MGLAEARTIWQRTANRCLVQEDAKRAPKLACGSSVSSSVRQVEADDDTGSHDSAVGRHHIPATGSAPFNPNSSQFNFLPTSKRRMQLHFQSQSQLLSQPPNCGYQQILEDEQFNSLVGNPEACCSDNLARNEVMNEISTWDSQDPFKVEVKADSGGELIVEGLAGCEVSKKTNELLGLNSGASCWIGGGGGGALGAAHENTPWWRTADEDELALLVARRSLDRVENCDLPCPRNPRDKKAVDVNICSSFLDSKLRYSSRLKTVGSTCQKHGTPTEDQLMSCSCMKKPSGDKDDDDDGSGTHARIPRALGSEAKLLEALCHSQTRAREAERAAKEACTEKERVIKLVLKQASDLFAYKQWQRLQLLLLQLNNMEFQLNGNVSTTTTVQVPMSVLLPASVWTPRIRKMPKRSFLWQRSSTTSTTRRLAKQPSPHPHVHQCNNISCYKYALVFAIGLGVVGAGFLLGSTISQMQRM